MTGLEQLMNLHNGKIKPSINQIRTRINPTACVEKELKIYHELKKKMHETIEYNQKYRPQKH